MSFSRRTFLRGLGSAALIAPFAHQFTRPRIARAATAKRVVFMYVPDGCIPNLWHPSGSETGFSLPEMTAPLQGIREHLTFIDGLEMFDGGATHEGGISKVLTGLSAQEKSLDVFLSEQIAGSTPHKHLQLGVASTFQRGEPGTCTFLGQGRGLLPDDDPLAAFARVFGAVSGGGNADDSQNKKRSILDAASKDLAALRAKLGATEKEKLDIHLQSLQEVEARISGDGLKACDVGSFNARGFTIDPNAGYPPTVHRDENLQNVCELQMDLLTTALSCGATNVVTLQFGHQVCPNKLGAMTMGNHDASHYGDPNSATADQFVLGKNWLCDRFSYLIDKLANTPDGVNGGMLLPNTVVVLFSELGDSNLHDHRRVPFVVAGGSALGFTGNRFLNYGNGDKREPHTKLLVTIANAVGLNLTEYNHVPSGTTTGELDGLRKPV